ncbi:MAG: SusC/RagA family TonB-linked outer membrane protein [Daejeonella sp.]
MRIGIVSLVILTTSIQLFSATPVKSQGIDQVEISIELKNESLVKAFQKIEAKSPFHFMYRNEDVKNIRNLHIPSGKQSVAALLKTILSNTSLNFRQIDKRILITTSGQENGNFISESTEPFNELINVSKDVVVKGQVTDTKGEPLIGVSVKVKGTNAGASTDINGQYSLTLPDGNGILVFTYIGFVMQEVPVNNRQTVNVVLIADAKSLDEVVVVGYGTLQKRDLTGSVATLDNKLIRSLPVATIDQKMVGQVAGVQVQQLSGAPGGGTSVKIRGSGSLGAGNEPLYVVDGMPYSAGMNQNLNPLIFINPNDIESITILKDASSTAIYGSRGANGVIMITTKKAATGRTEVNASVMTGVQQVPRRGRPQMLNQREFVELQREKIGIKIRQLQKREPVITDYPVEYRNPENLVGNGTDWYDLLLRPALTQEQNVSVLKGNNESRINFSMGHYKQDGVLRATGVERFSGQLGMDSDIGKRVKIGASLRPAYISQNRTLSNNSREDNLGVALWANPLLKPYNDQGELMPYLVSPQNKYHSAWSFVNPLFNLTETAQTDNRFQNLGMAYLEWEIIRDLTVKSSLNTNWSTSKYFQYVPSTVGSSNRPPTTGTGRSTSIKGENFDWLIENTLNYVKSFGNHRINALAGYTTQKSTSRGVNLNAGPYANDLLQSINAAQAINAWGENVNQWSMISYLGRINYSFSDRYLLTATFRSDGSSRFGYENRVANFPSVAAAWRVSEEKFLKNIKSINNLKLRASFGTSGNNNIGNYASLAPIDAGSYIFGNTQVSASTIGSSNPNLTWEESQQIDAGMDLSMFNNRLTVVVDVYNRKSKNMLLRDIIPAITGFNTQIVNKGNVRNRGLEFTLGGTPVISGEFQWDVNLNLAFNRNKVLSLNENGDKILSGSIDNIPTNVTVVGKPIGQFFGYIFQGLYTAKDISDPNVPKYPQVYEGAGKYADINGDGKISDITDFAIMGNPHPDYTFGFSNNFSYKNLSLAIIVNGQSGGRVVNGLRQTVDNLQGFFNVSKEWVNRWHSAQDPGDGKHYGIPNTTPSLGHRINSLWVEDASYLRIGNVTLGYTLPVSWMKRSGFINGARLYITAQNLAMFTRYGGANPEAQAVNINNTLSPGFDMTSYPLSRTVSAGLNLSF